MPRATDTPIRIQNSPTRNSASEPARRRSSASPISLVIQMSPSDASGMHRKPASRIHLWRRKRRKSTASSRTLYLPPPASARSSLVSFVSSPSSACGVAARSVGNVTEL
jgi:hypothetical protein